MLIYGTMSLSNVYKPIGHSQGEQLLNQAYAKGIKLFHSAYHYGYGSVYHQINTLKHLQEIELIIKIMGDPKRIFNGVDGINNFFSIVHKPIIDYMQLVPTADDYADGYTIKDIINDVNNKGPLFHILQELKNCNKVKYIGIELREEEDILPIIESGFFSFTVNDHSIIRQVIHSTIIHKKILQSSIKVFAIRPLASGWLTKKYATLSDFVQGDLRREWYYPGEEYRKTVVKEIEKYKMNIEEAAIRFLKNERIIKGIIIGMSNERQLNYNYRLSKYPPLQSTLYKNLKHLFKQPIILEP